MGRLLLLFLYKSFKRIIEVALDFLLEILNNVNTNDEQPAVSCFFSSDDPFYF